LVREAEAWRDVTSVRGMNRRAFDSAPSRGVQAGALIASGVLLALANREGIAGRHIAGPRLLAFGRFLQ